MPDDFTLTVVLEKDAQWYIAYCPEAPGANGQGRTKEEAIDDLKEAILLLWQDQREDMLKGVSPEATCETLSFA